MSVSILKQPNSENAFSVPIYPHANTGFDTATFSSTVYDSFLDFGYYVQIDDYKTDKVYKNLIPPLSISGYSYLNVIDIINLNVSYTNAPEITDFSASTEHMGKYKLTVKEYYNSIVQSSSNSVYGIYANTTKKQFLGGDIYDVNYLDYSLNDNDSKFLCNVTSSVQKVQIGDWGTWKAFYGGMQVIANNRSYFDELKIQVTDINGSIYEYTMENKVPWVNIVDTTEFDASNNTVEFPVMPANLNSSSSIVLDKITLSNGYVFYPGTTGGLELGVGDKYRIHAYSTQSPYLNQRVSQYYYFEVECGGHSDMQVSWENELGGSEHYNFSNKETVQITNKVKTYKKDRNGWTDYPGAAVGFEFYYEQTTERRDVIYQSEYREKYTLVSRLLNKEEVTRLKSLFYSKNIEIRIDGKWRPALPAKATMKLINSKKPGLKYYKFDIIVDTNKNLI